MYIYIHADIYENIERERERDRERDVHATLESRFCVHPA